MAWFGDDFSTVSAQLSLTPPLAASRKSSRSRRSRAPAPDAAPASYARYSSDNQDEKSIVEQQQACREAAARDGLTIAASDEFVDEAVAGTVISRCGLDRLLEAARAGRISRIYIWSLSRLSRESVQAQAVFKELVYERSVRIISVTDGIDTERENWQLQVAVTSVFDEHFLKQLRNNVMRGQRGTVDAGYAIGDHRFGYVSIPSPDGATRKRNGFTVPRKCYAIEPRQAAVVQEIFRWYAIDERSIMSICRELNSRTIDKGHRASTPHWNRHIVIGILRCQKYVGVWTWGQKENRRDSRTGRKYQVDRDSQDPLIRVRHLPELRIVSDDLFEKAQARLDHYQRMCEEFRDARGRIRGAHPYAGRKALFRGQLVCAECGRFLVSYSDNAKHFACPKGLVGACSNRGMMRRDTVQKLILSRIADSIVGDEAFIAEVHRQTVAEFNRLRAQPQPDRQKLVVELADVQEQRRRLVAFVAKHDGVDDSIADELRSLKANEQKLESQLRSLESAPVVEAAPPTLDWVRDELRRLNELLAAGGDDGGAALRKILNGPIQISQVDYPGDNRRVWQARFWLKSNLLGQPSASAPATNISTGNGPEGEDNGWITVLLREPPLIETQGQQLFGLLKAGRSLRDIAVEMNLSESRISFIVKHVQQHNADGLTAAEVRALINANRPKRPSRVEQILDQAMELWDRGLLNCQIAQILNTNRDLITKTIRLGCERRGTPLVDGRTRRKGLAYRGRKGWPTMTPQIMASLPDSLAESPGREPSDTSSS